jgi:hypothetical protein
MGMALVRGSVDLFCRYVRALGLVSRESLAAWFLFHIFGVGAHFWDVVFRAVKLSLAICVLHVRGLSLSWFRRVVLVRLGVSFLCSLQSAVGFGHLSR